VSVLGIIIIGCTLECGTVTVAQPCTASL